MMQIVKRITKYRTMCSPELVACGAWLLNLCLAAGAAIDEHLLEIWRKIDPMATRFTAPDKFDDEGNALTHKVESQDGPVSEEVWRP
jgi:hypothetical protein